MFLQCFFPSNTIILQSLVKFNKICCRCFSSSLGQHLFGIFARESKNGIVESMPNILHILENMPNETLGIVSLWTIDINGRSNFKDNHSFSPLRQFDRRIIC